MKVIVVGAGIAGLSTAWALTKRGHSVALIEQGTIPNPLSASGDHHRIIRRAYRSDSGYGRLITEAYAAWDELWADLGASHLDPRGFLCVSREAGDEAEDYRGGLEMGGYPIAVYDPPQAARRWRFLAPGTFRYAFLSPEGGALHCRHIATGMAGWLRRKGAELRERAKVVLVDSATGRVALSDGTTLTADRVVVTAGAWVLKLFPQLGDVLKTYRTAVVYLEPPADLLHDWKAAPVILDVGGATDGYIIPPSGGAGLKFGSGLHKEPTDDADRDRVPRPGEGEEIRALFEPPIARMKEYRVTDVVTCAYTFTRDERFLSHAEGRSLVVSACSGHGYKFGAALGRRVADAVESGDSEGFGRWLTAEIA
ncbi:MAG: NAD(P)/FAD-dependent oxidoreductase [Rhizobiaceae bacterium]